jgi:hypothetical protein
MKLSDIIAALRETVEPWINENGGVCTIAKDPWHAYELIASGPRGLICVIGYGGRSLLDGPQGNPLAQMRFELVIGNGMGLDADTGAAVYQAIGDRPALTDLLDTLTQKVSEINLALVSAGTTTPRFLFQGDEPFEIPNGLRLAAFRLTFNLVGTVLTTPQPV